jgi:hypothetical protein
VLPAEAAEIEAATESIEAAAAESVLVEPEVTETVDTEVDDVRSEHASEPAERPEQVDSPSVRSESSEES